MVLPSQTLARTRLRRPRLPAGLVRRERLFNQLDHGVAQPLLLVAAPPGFGKTTLVAGWLDTCIWPSAWLSLDEGDSDLRAFLAYFLAAIQTLYPRAGGCTGSVLNLAGQVRSPSEVAASVMADLDEITTPFILVLDDYQAIREPAVHALVGELVLHPPPSMHIVLIARQDPPLPLSDLRANGQMIEVRGRDLLFTTTEIAAFVHGALGSLPDERGLAVLEDRTEGWAAGLRLAALSLNYGESVGAHLPALESDTHHVMEYLLAEVLLRQAPPVQEFLLKTAILDRMNGSLCEAVTGLGGGQAYLDRLETSDLFITAMDDEHQWYRYHPLFRQLLRHELEERYGAAEIARCHIRAGAWFAEHGMVDEALRHALLGGDAAAAVRLVAMHRHTVIDRQDRQPIERWLRLIPPEIVQCQPDLLIAAAWLALDGDQHSAMEPLLARAESLLSQPGGDGGTEDALKGEIAALRSHGYYHRGDSRGAIASAELALRTTPPGLQMVRAFARLMLAAGYQMAGDLGTSYTTLDRESPEFVTGDNRLQARILNGRCLAAWAAADLVELHRTTGYLLELPGAADRPATVGWAHAWQGVIHYQRNNLTEAETHLAQVLQGPHSVTPRCFAQAACQMALTYQAQSLPDRALEVLESARSFLVKTRNARLLEMMEAFSAELALIRGEVATAARWAARTGPELPLLPPMLFYQPQMTLPKVLLAQGTPETRQAAATLLSGLYGSLASMHNTRFLIEVLALQALVLDAQGHEVEALAALEQAIVLAQPGRFIRLFLDLGPRVADLLKRLCKRQFESGEYADEILAGFHGSLEMPEASPSRLVEPLTGREMEILRLLSLGQINKQIAQELVISPKTVKRHALNIYRKLRVDDRQSAVDKAMTLGILRP